MSKIHCEDRFIATETALNKGFICQADSPVQDSSGKQGWMLLLLRAISENCKGQNAYLVPEVYSLAWPIEGIVQLFDFKNDLWIYFLLFWKDYSAAAVFYSF